MPTKTEMTSFLKRKTFIRRIDLIIDTSSKVQHTMLILSKIHNIFDF